MKAHIVGICGVGMSGTALLLKEAGWDVSGSDAGCYGPPLRTLTNAGITPLTGYSPHNIPEDTDLFVIGRNAKLSPLENAEVRAAIASNTRIQSFPEVIGTLTKDRPVVVVAGSYGKSTTSAILAHLLFHMNTGAGWFVGAEPLSLPSPAHLGSGLFVAEGDEYPSAHNDTRAKFMHLHPKDVLLTSVVHDHVNVYPTFEEYKTPFKDLLSSLPEDGLVVVSMEEPHALALAKASGRTCVTYGVSRGEYQATNIVYGEKTTFTRTKDERVLGSFSTHLLGKHNVENMVGALAYLLERHLVRTDPLSLSLLEAAVLSFGGVRRRLDRVTPQGTVPAYEGFGSSYEKARSAIAAMRLHFPKNRLIVVFEPHTFGWRNRANLTWYDHVFSDVSHVFVAPPELQGKGTHDQLTHEEILSRISGAGIPASVYSSTSPEEVKESLQDGDVVLILSSGDFDGSLPLLITSLSS